jgi:CRISPR-associated protein Cas2
MPTPWHRESRYVSTFNFAILAPEPRIRLVELSAYRFMWVVVLFDLPVDTKAARHAYAVFRKRLLKDGFTMLQYSVYARHSTSEENATVHINRVQNFVPDDGEVRILTITDKQFERMRIFWGKIRKLPAPQPKQLEFF